MKDNVDLTIDRKFSRPGGANRISDLRSTLFKLTTNIKFPWAMNVPRITVTLDKSNSLVLTGNKKERANKRIELDYMHGTECECCGTKLDRKPWTRGEYLLCSRCDFSLEDSLKKTYWLEQRSRFVKINPNHVNNISTEEVSLAELVLKVEES